MRPISSALLGRRHGITIAAMVAGLALYGCGGGEQQDCSGGAHTQTRTPCQQTTTQATQDASAPSTPGGLSGSAASPSLINLSWTASSDNVSVSGYRIYRNGILVATVGNVVDYQDTGVTASTSYSYTVQAFDDAGNTSAQSPATMVVTPSVPDTVAPSTPTSVAATPVSASRINLSWEAATDNVAVTGYRVFRDGTLLVSLGNVTSYQDSSLTADTTYVYALRAFDAAGNVSALSSQANATTSAALDTTPPTAPTNLIGAAVSPTRIDLSWSASTDNDVVANYRVYREGVVVATVTSTTYQNTGLSSATTYSYRVDAIDVSGNASSQSSAITVTTLTAPDTTPPTAPTGLTATAVSPSRINLNWVTATDNVAVTGYRIFRNGVLVDTVGNVTTYASTGLAPSTTYSYAIRALDAADNVSGVSNTVSATTQSAPDTISPSVPGGLTATAVSASQINLSWSASTDNVAVTGYRIYRNGAFVATVGNVTTYQNSGLTASTTYSYNVDAVDASGNASGTSNSASATTLAGSATAVGRVFYDGFEDGTTNAWQQDDFRNRCQVVSSASDGVIGPYAGARMARCNWNGGVSWDNPAAYESLKISTNNYNDELFIRVRVRRDRNMSVGAKFLRIFYFEGGVYHDLFESTGAGGGNGLKNEGAHTGGNLATYWGDAPGDNSLVNTSVWHKVEYYIRQSTGAIKVWHNGILVRNDTGINFQGVKWSPLYITSNAEEPFDSTNHIYFDEVEVYSDRGTGAIGSMSNATIQQ